MPSKFSIYDSAGNARGVSKFSIYDNATSRRDVSAAWVYDTAGNRRQFFSGSTAPAASFTINSAASLTDTNEGSLFGTGWGQFGTSNDNFPATTTPVSPPSVGGVGSARCLFTSFGNSGDVGLPGNLLIYGVSNQVVPNTDASFATLTIPGIGTFPRASATYYANGANSQGSEWHWTYAGPYFQNGGNYQAQFT